MQKLVRILLVGALIALGVWAWRALFPSPERVMRARLLDLAETVSFEQGEGNISRGLKLSKLIEFFTLDVEVRIQPHGFRGQDLNGRDEVMQAAAAARQILSALEVELFDINITVAPDKQTAVANLTAKVTPSGDRDFFVQELNFRFRKVEKRWLIYQVETVQTLSSAPPGSPLPFDRVSG